MADGSLGYASRLSYREDLGGRLGAPELFEEDESHGYKVDALAELVANSQHMVCTLHAHAPSAHCHSARAGRRSRLRAAEARVLSGGLHRRGHLHLDRDTRLPGTERCMDATA